MNKSFHTVVLALTCLLSLFAAAEASAIYDPGTGRFLQRDPSGTPGFNAPRFGGVGVVGSTPGSFIEHDDAKRMYPDGMNLYAAYHVLHGVTDPSGLSKSTQPEIKLGLKGAGFVDPGFTGYDMSNSLRINETLRKIKNHFDQDNDGQLTASDCPPFKIRLVGYSWGGWSALGVVDKLSRASWIDDPNKNLKVAVGTLDPVNTARLRGGLGAGGMPSFVKGSINIYQTNGCPGFGDCPGPSSWYKGESVPSATINRDVTALGYDHVNIKIFTTQIRNYVDGVSLK